VLKICVEKFTQVLSCVVLHPAKEARPQKSQKGDIGKKSENIFFLQKTGFVHSRCGSYYALFLGSFGLKILPDIRHCLY